MYSGLWDDETCTESTPGLNFVSTELSALDVAEFDPVQTHLGNTLNRGNGVISAAILVLEILPGILASMGYTFLALLFFINILGAALYCYFAGYSLALLSIFPVDEGCKDKNDTKVSNGPPGMPYHRVDLPDDDSNSQAITRGEDSTELIIDNVFLVSHALFHLLFPIQCIPLILKQGVYVCFV